MLTLLKLLQPSNAFLPIFVTEEGMVTFVSLVQFWNAQSPIFVTDEGMVTLVNLVLLPNAPFPITVTEDGIEYESPLLSGGYLMMVSLSLSNRMPSTLAYSGLRLSTVMLARLVQ
jgi:hypothetical protein